MKREGGNPSEKKILHIQPTKDHPRTPTTAIIIR
jgi:hypothetical protein